MHFLQNLIATGSGNGELIMVGNWDALGSSCSTDSSGNVYFAGLTSSHTNIASPGAFQTTYGGDPWDAFLAKFTTGGQRIWATYYGGQIEDQVSFVQQTIQGMYVWLVKPGLSME